MKNRCAILAGVCGVLAIAGGSGAVMAQAPGVEIVRDKGEQFTMLVKKANALREEGKLLSLDDVAKQIKRPLCRLRLPAPLTTKLTDRQIWERSKAAHVRVGWHYRCKKCEKWHQNLAGGYFINEDGAVATCHHVIDKDKSTYSEGYLIAATDQGDLFPVLEILAADELTDTAIVRIKPSGKVTALPLKVNTYPGDSAYCYSDPLGRSGYFSKGMINRFYIHKPKGKKESSRIEVSTDWAPGSSGAAVLDDCGNAIGHVSQISSAGTGKSPKVVVKRGESASSGKGAGDSANDAKGSLDSKGKSKGNLSDVVKALSARPNQSVIVFHCASRAADVLSLVEGR